MTLKIMDVTIRESTYIDNVHLNEENAIDIVKNLSASNIDFIEIGYISTKQNNNPFKSCSPTLINKLSKNLANKKSKLVLMMYPDEYTDSFLRYFNNPHIGLLRLCISANNVYSSIPLIRKVMYSHHFRYRLEVGASCSIQLLL